MKKFFTITLIVLGCFFGLKSYALEYWSDNFENYSIGDINGQGLWVADSSFDISTASKHLGSQGLSFSTWQQKGVKYTGTNLSEFDDVIIGFYYKTTAFQQALFLFTSASTSAYGGYGACEVSITDKYTLSNGVNDSTSTGTYTIGNWNHIEVGLNFVNHTCKMRIDDGSWTSTISMSHASDIVYFFLWIPSEYAGSIYIDDISLSSSSCEILTTEDTCVAAGCLWLETYGCVNDWNYKGPYDLETPNFEYEMSENISILPSYPIDCQTTADIYSGNATGKVSININTASSSITCNEIYMQGIESISNWSQTVFATATIDVSSGQTINYSIPYSFPATDTYSNDESWEISYAAKCHYTNYPNIKVMGFHQCNNTYIGAEPSDLLELTLCEIEYNLEQCTSSAWSMEKYTCELGNMVKGIFVPSCKNRIALGKNLDLMKGHAPYNYVIGLSGFMSNFINPTTTATEESTGTLAGLYAIQQVSINMGELSFFHDLRNMFTGVLMLMVGLYLFKRLKKLF